MNITIDEKRLISSTFPRIRELLYEGVCSDYNRIFISVFASWLPKSEVHQIFTTNENVIKFRQNSFKNLIDELYSTTPIFVAKFKRNRKKNLSIKRIDSRINLHKRCRFDIINQDNGDAFQLIIPEYALIYTQGFDWTHVIDYIDHAKAQGFRSLVESNDLHYIT